MSLQKVKVFIINSWDTEDVSNDKIENWQNETKSNIISVSTSSNENKLMICVLYESTKREVLTEKVG